MSILTYMMLGTLLSSGFYLMMSHRYSDLILGTALLSNGINLLLIESSAPLLGAVDPLPQALILTAIVIGFALIAFLASFILNRIQQTGNEFVEHMAEDDT